jgi:hypothetical protein
MTAPRGQANFGEFHAVVFTEHLSGGAIDPRRGEFDDGLMSETSTISPRRSTRIFHRMRVQAQGRAHNGKKFKETCETVVVNGHGGLLMLKHEIDNGEMLVIINPDTLEEQECRVVYLGEPGDRGQRVGVEFLTPAPHFWGLEFSEAGPSNDPSSVH